MAKVVPIRSQLQTVPGIGPDEAADASPNTTPEPPVVAGSPSIIEELGDDQIIESRGGTLLDPWEKGFDSTTLAAAGPPPSLPVPTSREFLPATIESGFGDATDVDYEVKGAVTQRQPAPPPPSSRPISSKRADCTHLRPLSVPPKAPPASQAPVQSFKPVAASGIVVKPKAIRSVPPPPVASLPPLPSGIVPPPPVEVIASMPPLPVSAPPVAAAPVAPISAAQVAPVAPVAPVAMAPVAMAPIAAPVVNITPIFSAPAPAAPRPSLSDPMDVLFDAAYDLCFLQSSAEGAHHCMTSALRAIGAKAALVHLLDVHTNEFVTVAASGEYAHAQLDSRLGDDDWLLSAAIFKGKPVTMDYGGEVSSSPLPRHAQLGATRNVVIVPIVGWGRALAVLELVDAAEAMLAGGRGENALAYLAQRFAEFLGEREIVAEAPKFGVA